MHELVEKIIKHIMLFIYHIYPQLGFIGVEVVYAL